MMTGRYARQLGMDMVGPKGQQRLFGSSVLVVGAGGLGSALLYCLAGAGVGHITLMDSDFVSVTDLDRQFLYDASDIGRPKADAARRRLSRLNSDIRLTALDERLSRDNADSAMSGKDVVILAVDNIEARLVANAAALRLGMPLINGGVAGMCGTVQTVLPGKTACLACLYGDVDADVKAPAALGAVVTAVSSMMAQAALMLLLCHGDPLGGRLLCYDGMRLETQAVLIPKKQDCPACGGQIRI